MRRERQTNRYSDKEFKVKGRKGQIESPRRRGAGKGKEGKRGGQAQAGGRGARRRDRQADWPSRAQAELLVPGNEIEMQRQRARQGVGRNRWRQVPGRRDSNHAHRNGCWRVQKAAKRGTGRRRRGGPQQNRLGELLPGTGLLMRWQQPGLSRRSPPPALPPQLDSPDSRMSNEFIKTFHTRS